MATFFPLDIFLKKRVVSGAIPWYAPSMPDANVPTEAQIPVETIRVAGILWREFAIAISGTAPGPIEWEKRLWQYGLSDRGNRDPLVTACLSAALKVIASIDKGNS